MPAQPWRATYGPPGTTHETGVVAARMPALRRLFSRRRDVSLREGRPLVTGNAPDYRARGAPVTNPVPVPYAPPAEPFRIYTQPRRRIGTVPKLAPGKQGSGLGRVNYAGFQTGQLYGFSPLESGPATQASFRLPIPRSIGQGDGQPGMLLAPTYHAKAFRPATRQFNQYRSSVPWAQAHFPPQFRPLTPSLQPKTLGRADAVVRRQIPAAQQNTALYTLGYPTRSGVAARLGAAGPVAVLGGNSQG